MHPIVVNIKSNEIFNINVYKYIYLKQKIKNLYEPGLLNVLKKKKWILI
jgi:hypothetical protein